MKHISDHLRSLRSPKCPLVSVLTICSGSHGRDKGGHLLDRGERDMLGTLSETRQSYLGNVYNSCLYICIILYIYNIYIYYIIYNIIYICVWYYIYMYDIIYVYICMIYIYIILYIKYKWMIIVPSCAIQCYCWNPNSRTLLCKWILGSDTVQVCERMIRSGTMTESNFMGL